MRAMILAAGRGSRLRPLTDTCPKPLLPVNGRPVIEYHLEALQKVGVLEVIINTCYLGDQIQDYIQDGAQWGLQVQYSEEETMLESGGGILKALPLLGTDPFIVLNADMVTDYPLEKLLSLGSDEGRLVCVPNSGAFKGDFDIEGDRLVRRAHQNPYTFSGISLISPKLFAGCAPGIFSIVPLYLKAIDQGKMKGELYLGHWAALESIGIYKECFEAQS